MPNDGVAQAYATAFEIMVRGLPPLSELWGDMTPTGRRREGVPLGHLTTRTGYESPLGLDLDYAHHEARIVGRVREQQRAWAAECLKPPPYGPEPKYITPAILPATTPYRPTLWEHLCD